MQLPEGFVLDEPKKKNGAELPQGFVMDTLPEGFVLDQPKQKPEGFVSGVRSDLQKRAAQLRTSREETKAGRQTPIEREIQELGTILGGIGDVVGRGMGAAAKGIYNVLPERVQRDFKGAGEYLMGTKPVQAGLDMLGSGMEKYQEFAQESPRAARNIEAVANIGLAGAPALRRGDAIGEAAEGVGRGVVQKFKPVEKMTSDELREIGGQLFKQADAQGGSFTPQLMAELYKNIDNAVKFPKTDNERIIMSISPGGSKLAEFENVLLDFTKTGKPLTLQEAQMLDEVLGEAAYSTADAFGKIDKSGQRYMAAQQALRETIEKAGAQDLVNKGAFDTVKEARKYWSASLKLRDIERIIERANNMEVPATSIKNGFNSLKNSKKFSTYTKAEQKAISEAAKTGVTTGLLKLMGSRLGAVGAGVGVGSATMNPLAGAAASAATYGAGSVARTAATASQMKKAEFVADLIRKRVQQQGTPDIKLTPEILGFMKELGITTMPAGGVSELMNILEEMQNTDNIPEGE